MSDALADLPIVWTDLATLTPHPRNYRRHPDHQIAEIAASLTEHGFYRPIVTARDGTILAGHGLALAAATLSIDRVPTVPLPVAPDDPPALRVLAGDNTLPLFAETDDGALIDLLATLRDIDDAALAGTGYDAAGVQALLDAAAAANRPAGRTDPDAVPNPPATPITQPGDLWRLGDHRLLCGDCTDPGAVARLMTGRRATLSVTSPPYNLGTNAVLSFHDQRRDNKYRLYDDENPDYLRLLRDGTAQHLAVSDFVFVVIQHLAKNRTDLIDWLAALRQHYADVLIWDKGHAQPAMAERVMNSVFEFVYVFAARDPSRAIGTAPFRGTVANVYSGPPQRNNDYAALNAATFPAHLPTYLIETFSNPGEAILDGFAGTGTTLIAAQLDRPSYHLDIDPIYCDIIVARWEAFTGQTAERVPSEVAA